MGLLDFFSFAKKTRPNSSLPDLCCVCAQALSGRWIEDYWKNRAHADHRLHFCSSCARILSKHGSAGSYQYSDGRLICGLCKKTAVADGIAANRSRRKVQEQLEGLGFHRIPKGIQVSLSHARTLSGHSRRPGTFGLTLTHFHFKEHQRVGLSHQIGVLFGLPKVEFEAVLAHEMLHVWQHENGVKFSPMYAEGLCELGGYFVYSQEGSALARYFLHKMSSNKDPVYGNGFRLMHKKLEQWGWKGLIQEILKNKQGFEGSILRKIFGSK